jgi:hypothetical protein
VEKSTFLIPPKCHRVLLPLGKNSAGAGYSGRENGPALHDAQFLICLKRMDGPIC